MHAGRIVFRRGIICLSAILFIGNSKFLGSEVNKQAKCRNREASLKKTL
ncbi:hypothetical protein T4B_12866 [Trichinella pseudospiralis]|uniref:Uncharacterized protein n=1 Tax=Trichinella pseudospiralis TaxID=6337 RepID=A0A0V1GCQ9_TRIPS|nr:hypothetical protein T4B_12866 [Trichinella pseudospiralis]